MCPLHPAPPARQAASIGGPWLPAPFPAWAGAGRCRQGPGLLPGAPHSLQSPSLLSCSDCTRLGLKLGGFPGLLYRLFQLSFCWGYQFSGFLGWLCFNLSPWSRLCRLPLSLGQEEMEGPPGLSGRLWSQWISRNRGWDRPVAPQPRQPASLQTGQ